jgi:hypothetical protein
MPAPEFLFLSPDVWRTTASLLEPYAAARVEAGCYWYGVRSDTEAVAAMVGVPHQINRRRNFEVAADDLAQLVRGVPDGLVAVAQVHTHPGLTTEHSPWDDGLIVSQKVFSLVLPDYGARALLSDAMVHEFADGEWRPLPPEQAARRIQLVLPLLDTRRG